MKVFFGKALSALLVAGALLSGCGEKKAEGPASVVDGDSVALRIGVLPTLECLPAFYAEASGLFDSIGVAVKLVRFEAAMDCDTAFRRGHLDGMFTDLVRAVLNNPERRCCVAMTTDAEWSLLRNRGLRIRKLNQVKERTLALARHSATDFYSDYVCEKAAVEKDEVHRPQVNNIPLRMKMLYNNQVDAAFLPQPYVRLAQLAGCRSLFASEESKMALGAFVFTDRFRTNAESKQKAALFVQIYDRAAKALSKARPALADELLKSEYDVPETLVDSIPLFRYGGYRLPSEDAMQQVNAWIQARGLKVNPVSRDSFLLSVKP